MTAKIWIVCEDIVMVATRLRIELHPTGGLAANPITDTKMKPSFTKPMRNIETGGEDWRPKAWHGMGWHGMGG